MNIFPRSNLQSTNHFKMKMVDPLHYVLVLGWLKSPLLALTTITKKFILRLWSYIYHKWKVVTIIYFNSLVSSFYRFLTLIFLFRENFKGENSSPSLVMWNIHKIHFLSWNYSIFFPYSSEIIVLQKSFAIPSIQEDGYFCS